MSRRTDIEPACRSGATASQRYRDSQLDRGGLRYLSFEPSSLAAVALHDSSLLSLYGRLRRSGSTNGSR